MHKDILHKLAQDFDPRRIKRRRGPGGVELSYLETHSVIARLNQALDGDWDFDILEHWREGEELLVLGRLRLLGDEVIIKTAFGSATLRGSLGDAYKSAASDCLKKAATLFGVGLQLYEQEAPVQQAEEQQPKRPRVTNVQLAKMRELVGEVRNVDWRDFRNQVRAERGVNPEFLSRRAASELLSELIDEARSTTRGVA